MIGISKLLCGMNTESDGLRYNDVHGHSVEQIPYQHKNNEKKPIVVWNSTQRCNLNCVHCYASAKTESNPNELTTNDVKLLLEDLAQFKIPVFLFSGLIHGSPILQYCIYSEYSIRKNLFSDFHHNSESVQLALALYQKLIVRFNIIHFHQNAFNL